MKCYVVVVDAQSNIDVEDTLFCLDDWGVDDVFKLKYFTIRDKVFSSKEKAMTALNEVVEELIKIEGFIEELGYCWDWSITEDSKEFRDCFVETMFEIKEMTFVV